MKLLIISIFLTSSIFANNLKKVKIELLWTHQFEFAGFYMAKEKGFYKEAGLEVEILDGFQKNTLEDVLNQKVDFGVSSSKIIYDAIKGKEVVALASIFQSSPYAWVVTKDSKIESLNDFIGKTIMHAQHSLDNIELLAMLKARSIDTSKINFIPTNYNIDDLIEKKCDVTSSYISNEPYALEAKDIEYTLFKPIDEGIDFYGDILFTSKNFLKNNPQTVKKFREASLRGWQYAFENIEETISLIHKHYNPSRSLGHLRFEANILKDQSLYPFVSIGTMNMDRWAAIAQTFKDLGYLDSAEIPDGFIYTEDDDGFLNQKLFASILLFSVFVTLIIVYFFKKHNNYLARLVRERTQKLEIEKRNYEALSMGSIDGVLLIKDGKFIRANDAILKMLNYDNRDEFLNLHPSKLSPEFQPDGQSSETKADLMMSLCMKNGSHRFEWVHRKKSGEDFWCDISLTKIVFDGETTIHVLWKDISRQKALEEHLENEVSQRTKDLEIAMRVKSEFLANMSHEIRTPLNAIKGFVDLLHKDETDSEKHKKLKIIKDSGDSLLTIINDILDFSKIENHKLLIEAVPLNIRDLFNQVVELFYEKAQENNILIKIEIDDKLPDTILGDTVRVKQIFLNILSNAVKFSRENGVVKVSVKELEEGKTLLCEVVDNGVGIVPKRLDDIFNSFTQEDSSTTRKFGGTGLGLSISKSLIKMMGGDIGVKSEPNVGSTFFFTLPIVEAKDDSSKELLDENKEDELNGKVLIVEDNKSNQMLMTLLLDELGLESVVAEDGLEAVKAVIQDKYDLVLMDENMPNMNGIEATKEIRSLSEVERMPIIAVTANALKGDKERFLESGMDDYLPKPVDSEKLEKIIRKYL